jgi:hypothetical protein
VLLGGCEGSFGPYTVEDIAWESEFDVSDLPVAVAGNYAAVTGEVSGSGVVDVYRRSGETWTKVQRIFARRDARNDRWAFAVAVTMTGKYLAVSGRSDQADTSNNLGYVDIYRLAGTTYAYQRTVSDEESHVYSYELASFGRRLASDGENLLVSAPTDLGNVGRVTLFDLPSGALKHTFDVPSTEVVHGETFFGSALAISGNRLVIGMNYLGSTCPLTPCNAPVYVYEKTGTTWNVEAVASPDMSEGAGSQLYLNRFGTAVGIVGNWLAVAAINPEGAQPADPRVYFYVREAGAWQFEGSSDAPGVRAGLGIAANNGRFVVGDAGGTLEGDGTGRVRVFLTSEFPDSATADEALEGQIILPKPAYSPVVALAGPNLVVSTPTADLGALLFRRE